MAAARPAGSTVTKIDPGTGKAVGSPFGVGAGAVPTGIAVGGGSVWVAVNRGRSLEVVELGPEVGEPRNEIVVDRSSTTTSSSSSSSSEPVLLPYGAGSLWALEVGTGQVWRIDPKTSTKTLLTEGVDAWSIAYGDPFVWLGGQTGVTRLDPRTRKTRSVPLALGFSPSKALAIGPDAVWFVASGERFLFRIEPSARGYTKFDVARGASANAVNDHDVWVANNIDGSVARVDPETGAVASIPHGNTPGGIVSSSGLLWTTPGEPVAPS
jgi:streptogramin lyase